MPINFTTASVLSDVSSVFNEIGLLAGQIDVVGIYFYNTQIWTTGRPLKATLRETSRVMDHPVETGAILSDHHILNPIEIDIPLFVAAPDYVGIYQQVKNAYISAELLTIKTRLNVYSNMILVDMPHEETPDMFDGIVLNLHFRQVIIILPGQTAAEATNSNFAPLAPLSANTVQSGLQQIVSLGTQGLASATAAFGYAQAFKKIL